MSTITTPERSPDGAPESSGSQRAKSRSMLDPTIVKGAVIDSFRKLHPRTQARNPVMFVVLVGSA
jgi:K+-transporting ATPase ATPase B chain